MLSLSKILCRILIRSSRVSGFTTSVCSISLMMMSWRICFFLFFFFLCFFFFFFSSYVSPAKTTGFLLPTLCRRLLFIGQRCNLGASWWRTVPFCEEVNAHSWESNWNQLYYEPMVKYCQGDVAALSPHLIHGVYTRFVFHFTPLFKSVHSCRTLSTWTNPLWIQLHHVVRSSTSPFPSLFLTEAFLHNSCAASF